MQMDIFVKLALVV